jgi:ribonuclease R
MRMTSACQQQILSILNNAPKAMSKNDLVKALGKTNFDRIEIKNALHALTASEQITKHERGGFTISNGLPSIGIIEVTEKKRDGDIIGKPTEWKGAADKIPSIYIKHTTNKRIGAIKVGDRFLAAFKVNGRVSEAKLIQRMDTPQNHVVGTLKRSEGEWIVVPTNRRVRDDYTIPEADLMDAIEGDVVKIEVNHSRNARRKPARIIEVIGDKNDPKTISLIAIHEKGIRDEFSAAALEETRNMTVPDLKGRVDMRHIPLLTIDPADARDRDDAVFAQKTDDGYHIIVAIADVAHYVRPGSALDKEAFARGNSTYFPDRVVPMLPEKLSNNLCSLAPNENRACLAHHLFIDKSGNLTDFYVERAIMNSVAALSYEQAQDAVINGILDEATAPIKDTLLQPLFDAYKVLRAARERRGALEIVSPERRIVVDEKGEMTGVKIRPHFEAHEVIEEMMVLTNIAVAKHISKLDFPSIYRVHAEPPPEKVTALNDYLTGFSIKNVAPSKLTAAKFNAILKEVADSPYKHLLNDSVLRSQTKAEYSTENIGHFGLATEFYQHSTSPIRRYPDITTQRNLIKIFNLGSDGTTQAEIDNLDAIAEHVSFTERMSTEAERVSIDRFTAAYLSQFIGDTFAGRIRNVNEKGIFVGLDDTGADGFVPLRSLPRDEYYFNPEKHCLTGRYSGRIFRIGAPVNAVIVEANRMTGSMIFAIENAEMGADVEGADFGNESASALKQKQQNNRRGNSFGRNNKHKKGNGYGFA